MYTLAATNVVYNSLKPAADYFATLNLPEPLVSSARSAPAPPAALDPIILQP